MTNKPSKNDDDDDIDDGVDGENSETSGGIVDGKNNQNEVMGQHHSPIKPASQMGRIGNKFGIDADGSAANQEDQKHDSDQGGALSPNQKIYSYQFLKEQESMRKQRERAAQNCRIQINKFCRNKGARIDYLTPMIENRKLKNAPLKPYDWEDILQRSKMKAKKMTNKSQTFISHLNTHV